MNAGIVEITVRLPVDLAYLHFAAKLSRMICGAIDDPELEAGFTDAVELAVSEACTNALRHGKSSGQETCWAILTFSIHSNRLIVQIEDSGPGFDMDAIPEPDFDARPDGGYGLYIIRSCMDEVSYHRGSPYNSFTMAKYFRNT